jgi:hypothetical protein
MSSTSQVTCIRPIERTFQAVLSYAQELISVNGLFVAAPAANAPTPRVIGKLLLRFSPDLSSVKFRLSVFNNNCPTNINQLVTLATLQAGRTFENGPVIATLFTNAAGIQSNGVIACGILTNAQIQQSLAPNGQIFNTVASLLQGIRTGNVYVNVYGSGRNVALPSYATGLIRGQILARETD